MARARPARPNEGWEAVEVADGRYDLMLDGRPWRLDLRDLDDAVGEVGRAGSTRRARGRDVSHLTVVDRNGHRSSTVVP